MVVMNRKVNVHDNKDGGKALWFTCPGCEEMHAVQVAPSKHSKTVWGWNGSLDKPTFTPSLLVQWTHGPEKIKHRCHSFIKDGQIQFLNDCTHKLKGQTVDLLEIDSGEGV
jgi:hypothetical protein